jgi:hypothetical protein
VKAPLKPQKREPSYRFFSRILKRIPTGKKTLIKHLHTEKNHPPVLDEKKPPLGGFKL